MTPTILLVEDDPNDEQLIRMALEEGRIKNDVVCMQDGTDALDFLRGVGRFSDRDITQRPQLILLDLNLPKMDGLSVLREIRNDPRTRSIPVVIFTSSEEERDRMESYDLGANSFVQKPVNISEFNEAVKDLGLYWLIWNEIYPPVGKAA